MAKEFKFPDIGEGITEGEVVRWLVKEGDEVKEDQTLAEIETDKAVVEVPSPFSGTVLKLHFKEKDLVNVGQTMVTIGEKNEDITKPAAPAPQGEPESEQPAPSVIGEIKDIKTEIRDILAAPKVRRLALERGVDLKTLAGSGPGGRITEQDVQSAAVGKASSDEKKPALKIKSKYDFYGILERIPLRGVRRATAKKMAESVATAAHVTHFDEADVTRLVELRSELMPQAKKRKTKLTYLPFVVKAVIEALKLHPTLNASLDDEEQEIIVKKYYNIGIAVDVPDGLIVPVIKAADQKSTSSSFQLRFKPPPKRPEHANWIWRISRADRFHHQRGIFGRRICHSHHQLS